MRLSARNILKGKIVEVNKGATTAHVRIQLTGGPGHHFLDHE
jgi:molybdopterin-binding protein